MAGSIQKIGDKFRVTFELGFDKNGKRLRRYKTVSTKTEAKRLLTEHNYNGQEKVALNKNNTLLSDFLKFWIEKCVKTSMAETTLYGYKNIIKNHINPYFGKKKLIDLESEDIQAYYTYLIEEKGLSTNTALKHHALLHPVLKHATKLRYIRRNVADDLVLPKKNEFVGTAYTPEQLKNLLALVKGGKLELPIYLAGYMGLRREEITGLEWKRVNLEERLIEIVQVRTAAGNNNIVKKPKTKKSRRKLYIVDDLYDILLKHKDRQAEMKKLLNNEYYESDYVYVKDNGEPYRVNTISEQFKRLLVRNDLPRIRFHDLRHTFSSILFSKGVDLKSISAVLGHSKVSTTSEIYTHFFNDTNKSALNMMEDALK